MLWPPGNVIAKRFQALVKSVLSEVELRHVFLDDLDKLSGAVKRCGRQTFKFLDASTNGW